MKRPTPVFVTATGTDIGKTYVSAGIIRKMLERGKPVVALKPLISGVPDWDDAGFAESDTATLLGAQRLMLTQENVDATSPWRFKAPLSPDMAARLENRSLAFEALVDWTKARIRSAPDGAFILVEGAGGILSPLTESHTNLDLLLAIGARVLLVGGTYLGTISHTLSAVEVLQSRGVSIESIIISESRGITTRHWMRRWKRWRALSQVSV